MEEGNDLYAFMEKSVIDPTITNVLILLDPQYKEKANGKKGGVGTETQIISPAVYNKVEQTKFLPIVFEREKNGDVPVPQYLASRLYFDLSQRENYDVEYKRLVKKLYGIEIIKKPEKGKRPVWLNEEISISTKTRVEFKDLENKQPDDVQKNKFRGYLNFIKSEILNFKNTKSLHEITAKEYISLYDNTKIIRDKFLELIKYRNYISEYYKEIAIFLEGIHCEVNKKGGEEKIILQTLLHEIFIYIIAVYLKNREYKAVYYTLGKTYFENEYYGFEDQNFNIFYKYNENLDKAMCKINEKNYYSGTAEYWINNINIDICNKNDFIFADILCYNASIFIENYKNRAWFPLTYCYGNELFKQFSICLKSREHLSEAIQIFGFKEIENFKKKFLQIENEIKNGEFERVRYSMTFNFVPIFHNFIKSEELGTRN